MEGDKNGAKCAVVSFCIFITKLPVFRYHFSIQFFGEISLELLTVFQSLRRKATFIFFFGFSFWTSSKFINVILNIEIHIYVRLM